ncbi:hypothetical protein CEP88_00030 (plasmid) [Roseobacter denitrificans]|uniref:hypothetical protein n=1 Tax=Roseobacter denitrificans TaxID=2434 RepID=UPI0005C6128D|nr:hypothetical protein [Roseobacter denitrificans]AVL51183.1 hypothetical protein CEP88_00030 [Roseobacter denitrificans]SFG41197.1 hypothetical protein SAMN05443635_11659 [Roseobacter denitrificans OCh 114]
MKLLYAIIFLTVLIAVLFFADKYGTRMATSYLTADNSPIYDRADPRDIDWEAPDPQACEFARLWGIFPYQTCYYRVPSPVDPNEDVFGFLLTAPPRFFSPPFDLVSGRTPESYRFILPVQTEVRFVFFPDGTFIERRKRDDRTNDV